MANRLAIVLLYVLVTCSEVRVWAQDNAPTNALQPPSLENIPRLLPPPVPPPPPQLTPPSTPPETSTPPKLPPGWVQGPQKNEYPPYTARLAAPGEPIAGIAQDEALEIYKRNEEALRKLPGSISVSFYADGIVVETTSPNELPVNVEGLPVIPVPPVDPVARARAGLEPLSPESYHLPDRPELAHPDSQPCPFGTFRVLGEGRCRRANPPPPESASELKLLPPPSGVIVLKPGKVREQADSCPKDFEEVEGYGGWRFCVDPQKPESIPPLWSPPINGIPFEEALAIHDRHTMEFMQLPGVQSVGLGADGIYIVTSHPELIPKEVEGVPIIVRPPTPGLKAKHSSHTFNTPVRPLHGAIFISQDPASAGVLTSVGLSEGYPWLIFPAHVIQTCDIMSPCPISTAPLNSCVHYPQPGQTIPVVVQPPAGSPSLVGFATRWTRLSDTLASNDVAAAYMDDNLVARDGSLSADRRVETGTGTSIPFLGTPVPVLPPPGLSVLMRAALGPPHAISLKVEQVNQARTIEECAGHPYNITNQIIYSAPTSFTMQLGDSGSPIFDGAARLVGMLNWCNVLETPDPNDREDCGCIIPPGQTDCDPIGGGTSVFAIQSTLKFDSWYGTNTTDLSVQVYPAFRTVVAGQTACSYVYIKNTGTVTAQNVQIKNETTFSPQPTFDYGNPAGQWNTPYNIPAGQTATFAICMNLNQPQIPILWLLDVFGTNAVAPVYKFAYNNLATRWTSTPLPDPSIATATFSGDDVVHTGGPNGTGAFALTTVNNGASGPVTLTLDTDDGDGQSLPYTLWVCETNTQGQCISQLVPSLSLTMNAGAVRTFTVLAQGQGQPVLLNPYYNRIYFRIREGFNNPTGTLVGAAGLSITTN